jgi:hypothetical protein
MEFLELLRVAEMPGIDEVSARSASTRRFGRACGEVRRRRGLSAVHLRIHCGFIVHVLVIDALENVIGVLYDRYDLVVVSNAFDTHISHLIIKPNLRILHILSQIIHFTICKYHLYGRLLTLQQRVLLLSFQRPLKMRNLYVILRSHFQNVFLLLRCHFIDFFLERDEAATPSSELIFHVVDCLGEDDVVVLERRDSA